MKLTYNECDKLGQKYLNKRVLIQTNEKTEEGIMLGTFCDENQIVIHKGTYTLGIPVREITKIICLED